MLSNKAQSEAISHKDGPMLVLAGPGSGKTHVITKRIEYLIKEYEVRPEEILVITFTKYAANEMRSRFYKNVGEKNSVTIGTFHGVFYGILKWAYKIDGSNILSDEDKYRLLQQILGSLEDAYEIEEDEKELLASINQEIGVIKNNGLSIEEYEGDKVPTNLIKEIFIRYEKERKKLRKIDFEDMIIQCYLLFRTNEKALQLWQGKYRYILIDEFQDINQMQYDTIKMLAKPEDNLFIVGDDDQAIYGFRGAKPSIMLEFEKEYPKAKRVLLGVNYRSTKNIIQSASKVIKNNKSRYEKEIVAKKDVGKSVHVQEVRNPIEECSYLIAQMQGLVKTGVEYYNIAVLFRASLDARLLATKLIELNIPFQMKEYIPNIYEHFIAKNMLSYLKLADGNINKQSMLEVMNRPKRYISRESIQSTEFSFESLRKFYCDKEWMQDRIDELEVDLKVMSRLAPYPAIQYIRKKIGYDDFLKEYAKQRNANLDEWKDFLLEIEEEAKNYNTTKEWLAYIEEYSIQLKRKNNQKTETKGINLLTMHASKGLEYDHVFILGANEEVIPYKKAKSREEIEEERRMFYVAMTRAKERVIISYPIEKNGKDMFPSRFVSELLV